MKQLQFADIAGECFGMHFVVCGNAFQENSRWRVASGCSETLTYVCTAPERMEPHFFCTVKEAVSSLCILAGTVLPENFRITVFGLIRRVGPKIGAAFRNTAAALRFNRREICRQRGGLRL